MANKLRQIREALGMTLADVEQAGLGVCKETLHKYETEKISPSLARLRRLAEIYHVTVATLLGDHEIPCCPTRGPKPTKVTR